MHGLITCVCVHWPMCCSQGLDANNMAGKAKSMVTLLHQKEMGLEDSSYETNTQYRMSMFGMYYYVLALVAGWYTGSHRSLQEEQIFGQGLDAGGLGLSEENRQGAEDREGHLHEGVCQHWEGCDMIHKIYATTITTHMHTNDECNDCVYNLWWRLAITC